METNLTEVINAKRNEIAPMIAKISEKYMKSNAEYYEFVKDSMKGVGTNLVRE